MTAMHYPERIEFRAPAGTAEAVEAHAKPDEPKPDLWRRMVREWLAWTDKGKN